MKAELISTADNIYEFLIDKFVNFYPTSPDLPLKVNDWGVVWFDEFYDEKKDVKLLMNPKCLNLIAEAVLSDIPEKEVYFYDGKSVRVLDHFIDLSDKQQVYEFCTPFFAFDKTSNWMLEFNVEGCNFYGNKMQINNVVNKIGGLGLIKDMTENSLKEWGNVRVISEKEKLYYRNIFDRLFELNEKN
jgi:hypothetical protein